MCGRFSLTVTEAELNLRFEIAGGQAPYISRYNCAPTQMLAVITGTKLEYYKWGLIPSWAKDPAIGNKLINARAESISEKPSFRKPLRSQRCLVPADSFYEWKANGKKVPYRIFLRNTRIFSFAGLWDQWESPDGTMIRSFSIITTSANTFMKNIHDRMPVILSPEDESRWLSEKNESVLVSLLKPCSPEIMDAYPISGLINSPRNEGPELIKRYESTGEQAIMDF
jgi:putative SOS response-associated peptidase YedK